MSFAAAGATVVANKRGANVRSAPSRSSPVLYVAKSGAKATSTGQTKRINDREGWIQVRPYHAPNGPKGWVMDNMVTVHAVETSQDAEGRAREALEKLIASDKRLYRNGIETLAMLVKLQRKGVNVDKQKAQFARIARAFFVRQAKIRAKVPAEAIKVGETEGSRAMLAYVQELGLGDIGVAPIVAIIVIAVVLALAVTGIAALLGFFEEEYGDSVKNLKESEELKKALATLSPEEAAVVRNDLEQQIDKGYGQGRKDEAKEGWFSDIKNLALLAAGGFVVMKLMDTKKTA